MDVAVLRADMEEDVVGMEADMAEVSSEATVVDMAVATEAAMAVATEAQEVVVEEVMVEGTHLIEHRRLEAIS